MGSNTKNKRQRSDLSDDDDEIPKSFPRFLTVTCTTPGETASAISPLLLKKGVYGIAGDVKSVKPQKSGTLLIEVYRHQQAKNLLGTTNFCGKQVKVTPHSSLNTSKGVIRCYSLRNDTDNDILKYFEEEGVPVTHIRRISIKKQGNLVKTNTFVLTFNTPELPKHVFIGYEKVEVAVYIPNPLRCYNCQKFGHHEDRCKQKQVCSYCGREGHTDKDDGDCNAISPRCVNCEGTHPAYSRQCKSWYREKEILRIKHTENISFPEARKRVEANAVTGSTYATITKSNSASTSVTLSSSGTQTDVLDQPAFGTEPLPELAGRSSGTPKIIIPTKYKTSVSITPTDSTKPTTSPTDKNSHQQKPKPNPKPNKPIPPKQQKLQRLPTKTSKGSEDPIQNFNRFNILDGDPLDEIMEDNHSLSRNTSKRK